MTEYCCFQQAVCIFGLMFSSAFRLMVRMATRRDSLDIPNENIIHTIVRDVEGLQGMRVVKEPIRMDTVGMQ